MTGLRKTILLLTMLAAGAATLHSAANATAAGTDEAEREIRLRWFREGKFGLFIHWGLYALPAGYWKGARSAGIGEWIQHRMKIPVEEYAGLAREFSAGRFDADAWAALAADAGMTYVVLTAKHHDGFALFKSAASPFNVVDATPLGRDVVGELAAACARRGLRFGVYYSQAQDWHERGGAGNDWDFPSNVEKERDGSFDRYLQGKVESQLRELLTGYGPLALVWFDTPHMMAANGRAERLIRLVRTLQPDCLIDGRLGGTGDYVSTDDNVVPNAGSDAAWEVPATMNQTWGYRSDDRNWKSPGEVVFRLVDVVSKGGNYLLNVGPMADGTVPSACAENLRAAGTWLKTHGEAIYGAGRSPFGEEFGEPAARLRYRSGAAPFLAFTDWRCTTKPGRLYFTLFHVERDRTFVLPAFRNRILAAYRLDDARRAPVPVQTDGTGGRYLEVSREVNDLMGTVYVIEYEGVAVER